MVNETMYVIAIIILIKFNLNSCQAKKVSANLIH